MNRASSQIITYLEWVLKKYHEIKKELEMREAYRIVNIENDTMGITKVKVHIVGSGKDILFSPEELASNDQMIERFSKQDVRALTYYAINNVNKPKYKITGSVFCDKLKKILFSIKQHGFDNITEKTAADISADQSMMISMSQKDAHRVGYIYGSESILQETEEKKKLKNQSEN